MDITSDTRVRASRPKDRSLEAYKTWICEIAERLTTQKTMIEMTEEEWRRHWKDFWQQTSRP